MTPLLFLLLNGLPAGAWHVDRFDTTQRRLVESFGLTVLEVDIDPQADKGRLLDQIADRLGFPPWFGRNWDALNDSLSDRLSSKTDRQAELIVLRAVGRSTATQEAEDGSTELGEAATTTVEIFADVAAGAGVCLVIAGLGAGRNEPTAGSPG